MHVYRLVTRGTIEEKVIERAENKLYLDQMVNAKQASETSVAEDAETPEELLSALSFGAQAVAGLDSVEPPTEAELDAIIDRSRTSNQSTGKHTPTADAVDASALTRLCRLYQAG